ncbi:MAG: twin-arginine translocation signal domain-containing protein, partial [Planctomycetes bacterium]|nr:twin-arginine translocation signal domain-containing protein [Planctomycetota bacterium]
MPLSRRDFLATCAAGMSLAALGFDDPAGSHGAACLLLEARAFSDHGGWILDPQFEDQMGAPYLLAHGLGKPVAPARTTALFPATGTYHCWVRTRNWCPGAWEAPGRFQVAVAGQPLATVFGT